MRSQSSSHAADLDHADYWVIAARFVNRWSSLVEAAADRPWGDRREGLSQLVAAIAYSALAYAPEHQLGLAAALNQRIPGPFPIVQPHNIADGRVRIAVHAVHDRERVEYLDFGDEIGVGTVSFEPVIDDA